MSIYAAQVDHIINNAGLL